MTPRRLTFLNLFLKLFSLQGSALVFLSSSAAGCALSCGGGLSTHCTNYVAGEESSGSAVIFSDGKHFRGRCAARLEFYFGCPKKRSCVILVEELKEDSVEARGEMEIIGRSRDWNGHKLEVCHLVATAGERSRIGIRL